MAGNNRFTIGWISPIALEKEAARLVLDDPWPKEKIQFDGAFYLGGRIGNHEVIMGVQREIGINAAASLAEKMRHGFPNIKYFILVGIAGGVPRYGPAGAAQEIVLGDVVISSPRGNHGGVVQYDKGAWIGPQDKLFHRGHTNGIHNDLLMAINNFRSEGLANTNIPAVLQEMRAKLRGKNKNEHAYDDLGSMEDRLFDDSYEHQGSGDDDCEDCCDTTYITLRADRGNGANRQVNEPRIHFGNIASSDQLQLSATKRNQLQKEHEVICFEMEAAGVMAHPCVVVRGICDYADSHKNKGWQNYAAATAAACAGGLLDMIPVVDLKDVTDSPKPAPRNDGGQATIVNTTFGNNNRGIQHGVNYGPISNIHFGDNFGESNRQGRSSYQDYVTIWRVRGHK